MHQDQHPRRPEPDRGLEGFAYSSGTNPDFLSVEQLRALIRAHLDPHFSVNDPA
ncbi:hypothetical protein [Halochromatium roseum]|uniref:hypothetical protein n=1 Tax=Halochromatium roseum TaxID=391920 RepID=UPI0019135E33|nr:hypothetical protein [Halochromatium roseum]